MLFQLIICAIALLVLADIAHAAPQPPSPLQRKYDQMQSGDFNVRVNLKDVKVIALLGGGTGLDLGDDYMEYDYFYDEADFTSKPSHKPSGGSTTTPAPTTTKGIVTSPPASPSPTVEPAAVADDKIIDSSSEASIANPTLIGEQVTIPSTTDINQANQVPMTSQTLESAMGAAMRRAFRCQPGSTRCRTKSSPLSKIVRIAPFNAPAKLLRRVSVL